MILREISKYFFTCTLSIAQRLYKLYNDVIDSVNGYHNIPWQDVNIEEINNELMEFQNRCRKLPKGLKEWPAFHALKKTIDEFNGNQNDIAIDFSSNGLSPLQIFVPCWS